MGEAHLRMYGVSCMKIRRCADGESIYFTIFDINKDLCSLYLYNKDSVRSETFSNPGRTPILGSDNKIVAFAEKGNIVFPCGFTLKEKIIDLDVFFDPAGRVFLIEENDMASVWQIDQLPPHKLFDVRFNTQWLTTGYRIQSYKDSILIACIERKNGHFYSILIRKYVFDVGEWKLVLDKRVRTSHNRVDLRPVDIDPCCSKVAIHEAFFPTFSFRNGIYIYEVESDTLIKQKEWFVSNGLFLKKNALQDLN